MHGISCCLHKQSEEESSTSCCLASMTAVCLLRTCFSTYSLPTNSFWLSLQPHLPHQATRTERNCRLVLYTLTHFLETLCHFSASMA